MQDRTEAVHDLESLPLLMTAAEVARVLGVSERTVWRYRYTGILPVVKVGRAVRFSRDYIAKLLAEGAEDVRA